MHSDLKALLDLTTPLFYKARMEQIAEQPRKLLALLMEHWAPIGDLALAAGLPATTVSGQLNRLLTEGLVEKSPWPPPAVPVIRPVSASSTSGI